MIDIQDISAATHNLHQLLGAISETIANIPNEPSGLAPRAAALASIAHGEAARIDAAIEGLADAGAPNSDSESEAITWLGKEYDEARVAWIRADIAADKPNASKAQKDAAKRAEALHDNFRNRLFEVRPTTQAGFVAKAKVFLRIWNMAEGMDDDRIVQFLESLCGGE
jgi:hypothetical protein